ncbi:putative flavoprotein involved in K+ transport [Antricoccus suffuscus]|uniref:Putative flavoprotein involved in K+ transport n=2 Tax=Antricoccus suffuscus TaxID=1629062 RepID=A0A2T1A754_9ACTN|nr:putative flavoprotein involved in K+ transport [Antricoccus suffuscus]
MSSEYVETVVIGAGQAGLAVGYHLRQIDRKFLILDGNVRVGDGWRRQWDSLRLFSPASHDALPGMRFPAPKWSYPGKDEVADYLEQYAAAFDLPIRLESTVDSLVASADGYVVTVGAHQIETSNVVIATGGLGRTPYIPAFADRLDPGILQLHSSEYRRPAQLRPGPVLVVGASHSGCDLAYELAPHHPTTLCGRDPGQIPVHLDSPMTRVIFPVVAFVEGHVLTRRTPMGRRAKTHVRDHGAPMLRVKRRDLLARGVKRVTERVTDARGGLPLLADGTVVQVANVLWCTGFRQSFDWVDVPVFDDDGWPVENRGVTESPGLYFSGLSFQYAFSSMLIDGAGRDAAYVVRHIGQRERAYVDA